MFTQLTTKMRKRTLLRIRGVAWRIGMVVFVSCSPFHWFCCGPGVTCSPSVRLKRHQREFCHNTEIVGSAIDRGACWNALALIASLRDVGVSLSAFNREGLIFVFVFFFKQFRLLTIGRLGCPIRFDRAVDHVGQHFIFIFVDD